MKMKLLLTLLVILGLGAGAAYYLLTQGSASSPMAEEDHHDDHAGHDDHGHGESDDHHDDEMQTTIHGEAAARAGLATSVSGPASIRTTLPVYGRIKLNADRVARAVPRFGGIVREARVSLGDTVEAGDIVAVVESNQTLVNIEVTAPLAGLIVDRNVSSGETVGEGTALYTIADLSNVWVDLNVPKRDQTKIKLGQNVTIQPDDGGLPATGTISWISPISSAEAQTLAVRVVLENTDRRWRPGLFVKAEITLSETTAPVTVKVSGLQTLEGTDVVFLHHDNDYEAQPVKLGRRSGDYVEVLSGLEAGVIYVSENSFLIKADIGKSGAEHSH